MKTPDEIKSELVETIKDANIVIEYGDAHDLMDAVEQGHAVMADALAYIQQLENQSGKDTNVPCWISVKDGMPENEKSVLIATKRNFMGNNGLAVSCGFHTNGKSFTGNSYYNWDECYFDLSYEEEEDEYIVPEGWWESVRYSEQFSAVDEQVLYWMPLPGPPKDEEDEKKD